MARSRNIKPAFFTNDELAEIDPIGRLLFIGLWTIADCNGNIEWREKRIKAQILPYDECDIKDSIKKLTTAGFVNLYTDGHAVYINIANFNKHQNPHKNEREKGSDIPVFKESMTQAVDFNTLTINHDKSGLNHDKDGTNRADSLNLIPDPPIPDPEKDNDRSDDQSRAELLEKSYEYLWGIWKSCKKQMGKTDTTPKGKTFEKKWKVMFNSAYFKKHTIEEFKAEVNQMAQFCKDAHAVDGFNRFENMQLARFLSEKQWRD